MLSEELKARLRVAITDQDMAEELITAIENGVAAQADNVPVLGVTSDLPAAALSTSDTYTDSAVNTAINALKTAVESRLDAVEGKIDAVIGALVASGQMDS